MNYFGGKLNGFDCRRLLKHHIDIVNGIKHIFVKMNKGIVSDEEICLLTNKHKNVLNKMDEPYHCIRSLIVDDNLIEKTRIHIQKVIFLWRCFYKYQLHHLIIY